MQESLQLHEPKLGKWIGAKRVQQSGWSEQDIMAKTQEIYSGGGTRNFNLKKIGSLSVINHIMVVRKVEIVALEVVYLRETTRVMLVTPSL